jgi:hypothetical protein
LNKILENRANSKKFTLTSEQITEILLSKDQINSGFFIEQDTLDKSFEKWQKEK